MITPEPNELLIMLMAAALHTVGLVRPVRRRARRLRRYRGRYFGPPDLRALRGSAPQLAALNADALQQSRRLAGSRAWRQGWLPTALTDPRP